jgi:hypothetical protein
MQHVEEKFVLVATLAEAVFGVVYFTGLRFREVYIS